MPDLSSRLHVYRVHVTCFSLQRLCSLLLLSDHMSPVLLFRQVHRQSPVTGSPAECIVRGARAERKHSDIWKFCNLVGNNHGVFWKHIFKKFIHQAWGLQVWTPKLCKTWKAEKLSHSGAHRGKGLNQFSELLSSYPPAPSREIALQTPLGKATEPKRT